MWEFGERYTSELESLVYSYDNPGTYTVRLNAFSYRNEVDSYTRTILVIEGVNSALRITVLEYYDEYPVEEASVLLFKSQAEWVTIFPLLKKAPPNYSSIKICQKTWFNRPCIWEVNKGRDINSISFNN